MKYNEQTVSINITLLSLQSEYYNKKTIQNTIKKWNYIIIIIYSISFSYLVCSVFLSRTSAGNQFYAAYASQCMPDARSDIPGKLQISLNLYLQWININ